MKGKTLQIAMRHAFKNRMYVFANLIGLTIGFAAFYLIALYLQQELKFDTFHKESKNVYRVVQVGDYGGIVERSSSCPFPLAKTIENDYPEQIQSVVRLFNNQTPTTLIRYKNISVNDSGFFYTDPSFFKVFTVKGLKPIEEDWLQEPYTAIITKKAAQKYFGYENAVGRKLTIEDKFQVKITGIVENWPDHSHFHFNVLVSMSTYKELNGGSLPTSWVANPCWTYLRLKDEASASQLAGKLDDFVQRNFSKSIRDNNDIYLQRITDIHLKSHLEYEIEPNGDVAYVYIFGGIALFLLLMASINYINLTTATFSYRAQEIAIKKLQGASSGGVRFQLFIEALYIIWLASLLGIAFAELLMPWFNSLTSKNFELLDLLAWQNLLIILFFNVLVALVSGIYPSLFISRLRPVNILRGNLKRGLKSGFSRKLLVVSQLFVSTLLIFGAFTINAQYHHLVHGNNGVDRNNLVIIQARFSEIQARFKAFKFIMEKDQSVECVSGSDYIPGIDHNRHPFILKPQAEDSRMGFFPTLNVMRDFIRAYGLNIIEGRDFLSSNKDIERAVLINEEMVNYLGFENAYDALGASVRSYRGHEKVVGVIKDLYPRTLRNKAEPFIIDRVGAERRSGLGREYVAIRYYPDQEKRFQKLLKKQVNAFLGDKKVVVQTYQDIYLTQYKQQKIFNHIAGIMSILSVLISFIGLWGLISFMIVQKSQEIAIRKISGANIRSIMIIYQKEFLKLFALVIVLVFPVAWFVTNLWLGEFASRVSFSFLHYFLTIAVVGLLILSVTSLRVYNAARINPASALKYQ